MATVMEMMKYGEINTPVRGVAGVVLDGGIGFVASYGLGHIYHRYNDNWAGKNAPRIMAIAGKVGALGVSLMAGGTQTFLGNALNTVGQAGINAMGLELGLRHARKATGKKAVLVKEDLKLEGATELGARHHLGAAPAGRGLSWAQIEELASAR